MYLFVQLIKHVYPLGDKDAYSSVTFCIEAVFISGVKEFTSIQSCVPTVLMLNV